MARRLFGLTQTEAWAKDRLIEPGMNMLLRRHRVDALLYRRLQISTGTQVPKTHPSVFEQEDVYRSVYGTHSALSKEQKADFSPTSPSDTHVLFSTIIAIPPQSFVAFSDRYHSTAESTWAYTIDDRISPQDYLIVQHSLPSVGGTRSRRVYKVEHVESVGVTVQLVRKFIITPQMGLPEGAEEVLDGYNP